MVFREPPTKAEPAVQTYATVERTVDLDLVKRAISAAAAGYAYLKMDERNPIDRIREAVSATGTESALRDATITLRMTVDELQEVVDSFGRTYPHARGIQEQDDLKAFAEALVPGSTTR